MSNDLDRDILPTHLGRDVLLDVRLGHDSPCGDQCYKAIIFTESAFLKTPHNHQPTDRVETSELEFIQT